MLGDVKPWVLLVLVATPLEPDYMGENWVPPVVGKLGWESLTQHLSLLPLPLLNDGSDWSA